MDTLCTACSSINFKEIFDSIKDIQDNNRITVAHLGYRLENVADTDCSLCRLFFAVRFAVEIPTEYHLRAMSVLRSHSDFEFSCIPSSLKARDNVILTVLPGNGINQEFVKHTANKRFICLTPPINSSCAERIWAGVVPPALDYTILKKWHSFCLNNHSTCLVPTSKPLSRLRLIDRNNYSLVDAPLRVEYVALSYVWGTKTVFQTSQPLPTAPPPERADLELPAILSQTIQDAVEVTRKIGLRYLWVDKYCINQHNALEKQRQIAVLDKIYADAEITIVAAFGDDDDAGLPGVARIRRDVQPSARFGDICVVATLPLPIISIQSEKWATRGWTFQEAVLSRRRFVFTKDQVYFECRAMHCYESLRLPLEKFHTRSSKRRRFRHLFTPGVFSGYSSYSAMTINPEGSISQLRQHISNYTGRDLGQNSDSLNAFLGILNLARSTKPTLSHHYGLPFQPGIPESMKSNFLSSLGWTPGDSSLPYRPPLFPSWSWAGWKGKVHYSSDIELSSLQPSLGLDTSLETLRLHAFALDPDLVPAEPSHKKPASFTNGTSKYSPCTICTVIFNTRTIVTTAPPLHDGLDFINKLRSRAWECVYLGSTLTGYYFFLIIERYGTTAVRVASCQIETKHGARDPVLEALTTKRQEILLT